MKKITLVGISLIILSAVSYMIVNSITKLNMKSEGEKNTLVLSSLISQLTTSEGEARLQNFLKPSLLIYFNSECDYCQKQLEQINAFPEILKKYQLVLVSYQDREAVNSYLEKLPAIKGSNYALYYVSPENVLPTFGKSGVPQLFVYQDNLLKNSFKGLTKSETIFNAIEL